MVKAQIRILCCVILGLILTGCKTYPVRFRTTSTPPALPSELRNLPVNAKASCTGIVNLDRGSISIWDKFIRPENWEPDYYSDNCIDRRMCFLSERIGLMKACSPITILQYEWAGDDEQFYVYIEVEGQFLITPENQETPLRGWIGLDLVTFDK